MAADITTAEGRAKVFEKRREFDIVVTNAGGPPPGDFRDWDRDAWIKAVDANMLTPIELIKATVDGMAARGFGRIVNITSSAVKAPIDILGLSNGARSGLTGFVAGVARTSKLASANVTINNLLPGAFDTDRLKGTMVGAAQKTGQPLEAVMETRRGDHSGAPLRHARGVRRGLCLPVQPACRLHHGPEHPDRWRGVSGHVLRRAHARPRGRSGHVRPMTCHAGLDPASTEARQHGSRVKPGMTALLLRRDDTTIPPTISTNATAWYRRGNSPRNAAESSAANSGVRLAKKPAMLGPTRCTPMPQQR